MEAKSATNKTVKAVEPVAQTASTGATKTLTVPQGVSLMQVFRDNKLNIADVNAMTKANGAGNALSSFKPGDKVQVSVNGQGRVSDFVYQMAVSSFVKLMVHTNIKIIFSGRAIAIFLAEIVYPCSFFKVSNHKQPLMEIEFMLKKLSVI